VRIRHEGPQDAGGIARVHLHAFGSHGSAVAALVEDLRTLSSRESGLSLVAESGGEVVGHVMFSRGWVDAPARLVAAQILSPVGITPRSQGKGVATALVEHGLEILGARGVPAVFLEGDPGFYSRLGFVAAGVHGFGKPSVRIPDAGFQVFILPAHESWMTGALVYPDAFWAHDLVGLRDGDPGGPATGSG